MSDSRQLSASAAIVKFPQPGQVLQPKFIEYLLIIFNCVLHPTEMPKINRDNSLIVRLFQEMEVFDKRTFLFNMGELYSLVNNTLRFDCQEKVDYYNAFVIYYLRECLKYEEIIKLYLKHYRVEGCLPFLKVTPDGRTITTSQIINRTAPTMAPMVRMTLITDNVVPDAEPIVAIPFVAIPVVSAPMVATPVVSAPMVVARIEIDSDFFGDIQILSSNHHFDDTDDIEVPRVSTKRKTESSGSQSKKIKKTGDLESKYNSLFPNRA
jgi:hypothetical protein